MAMYREDQSCQRPGCGKSLESHEKRPYPCGHRICDCCLTTDEIFLRETRTVQARFSNREDDSGDCPVCQLWILSPGTLQLDVPILRKFSTIKPILDKEGQWKACSRCSERHLMPRRAEAVCGNCQKDLCTECLQTHSTDEGDNITHTIATTEDAERGKDFVKFRIVPADFDLTVKCILHKDEDLLYLCTPCQRLNCEECIASKCCPCKCAERVPAPQFINSVNDVIECILNNLKKTCTAIELKLKQLKEMEHMALENLKMLRESVNDELSHRKFMNTQLATFEDEKLPEDQLQQIEDHIHEIKSQCELAERKLWYTYSGKFLLAQAIHAVKRLSEANSLYLVALLAFLQFNKALQNLDFSDEFLKTKEKVTLTKCLYHQNCCEDIVAYPQSVQTGTIQIKPKRILHDTINIHVHDKDARESLLGGVTVLEGSNDIIVSDYGNSCIKCFKAEKLESGRFCLPEYKYKVGWRTKKGQGKELRHPTVIYTTGTSKLLEVVDIESACIFQCHADSGEVKRTMSALRAESRINSGTASNGRISGRIIHQACSPGAYLDSLVLGDAMECGIILPKFLANLNCTPCAYINRKDKIEDSITVKLVISGVETKSTTRRAVVLFLHNAILMRTLYLTGEDAPAITYNTADKCVYIADKEHHRVVVFTEKGRFVRVFLDEDDDIRLPIGIVFDIHGRLIVAQSNGLLKIFKREDEIVGEEVPKTSPTDYQYFVPVVSSLSSSTHSEPSGEW